MKQDTISAAPLFVIQKPTPPFSWMLVQESKTIDLLEGVAVPSYLLWTAPSTIAPTPVWENAEHCEM